MVEWKIVNRGWDYNKDMSLVLRILPPFIPPSRGGTFGRAGLQQRPRPREGDVQSGRNDHDWVRGFGGGIVELLNR